MSDCTSSANPCATTVHTPATEVKTTAMAGEATDRTTYVPQVDIREVDDGIVLYADLPGVAEDRLDITVDRNLLTIRGEIVPPQLDGYAPLHLEYGLGNYERAFTLSNEVDRERIGAHFEDGVLRLHLPKVQAAAVRKITVATNGSAKS